MQFLFLLLTRPCRHHHRSFVDFAAIKHVRDRGLDHAVEQEKHLRPLLNVKNLLKLEPAKSLPLSVLSQHKESLKIPIRPVEFIRKYPAIFEEYFPGGIGIHPHIKLTTQVLDLDAEEQLVYQSESYRQDVADRLLKLLMISRVDKIPLKILDDIKWDLGLPEDYGKSVVPDFPDYFRVIGTKNLSSGSDSDAKLELVCWSNDLAISFVEKMAKKGEMVCEKGMPITFPMQFSTGFEMDKKLKKWLDEWQKLPCISPYENANHLRPSSDESDKWAVAILHEVLNLFVSKKVERDTLLCLGEWLGIRSRFKRALLHHPGIFYLSSKIGTYTVVLKEAHKRGFLTEKNPVMDIRNQYIHLMHKVIEDHKSVSMPGGSKEQAKKTTSEFKEQEEKEDGIDSAEVHSKRSHFEDDSDDDYEFNDSEEDESKTPASRNAPDRKGRKGRADKKNFDVKRPSRNDRRERLVVEHGGSSQEKSTSRKSQRTLLTDRNKRPSWNSRRESFVAEHHLSSQQKSTSRRNWRTSLTDKRPSWNSRREGSVAEHRGSSSRMNRRTPLTDKRPSRNLRRERFAEHHGGSQEKSTSHISKRKLFDRKDHCHSVNY